MKQQLRFRNVKTQKKRGKVGIRLFVIPGSVTGLQESRDLTSLNYIAVEQELDSRVKEYLAAILPRRNLTFKKGVYLLKLSKEENLCYDYINS